MTPRELEEKYDMAYKNMLYVLNPMKKLLDASSEEKLTSKQLESFAKQRVRLGIDKKIVGFEKQEINKSINGIALKQAIIDRLEPVKFETPKATKKLADNEENPILVYSDVHLKDMESSKRIQG